MFCSYFFSDFLNLILIKRNYLLAIILIASIKIIDIGLDNFS